MPAESLSSPAPQTSNATSMEHQYSSDAAINLALLDPPKWGWSAGGCIVNLCTPHEMARRKEGRDRFLEQQKLITEEEEGKRLSAEKEKKSVPVEKEKSADETINAHNNADNNNKINNDKVANDSGTVENKDILADFPKKSNDDQIVKINISQEESAKALVSPVDEEKASIKIEQDGKNENHTHDQPSDGDQKVKAQQKDSENDEKINPVKESSETKSEEKKEEGIPVEGGILRKSKESDGTIKETIYFDGMSKDMTKLDIHSYHRGRTGLEPRDKADGMLLDCETWSPNEMNSGLDAPLLKFKVRVEFPLAEEEPSSESENESEDDNDVSKKNNLDATNDTDNQTNELNQSTTKTRTRSKQNQTIEKSVDNEKQNSASKVKTPKKQIPVFSEVIDWDLCDPKTLSPMDFATDIAQEFGLSFCQTLDLASSIQSQIDIHCQKNIKYCIPISKIDPVSMKPREEGSLIPPPISSIPNTLYGGHMATNITTTFNSSVVSYESGHQSSDGNHTSSNPRQKLYKSSSGRRVGKPTEVVPEHMLPSHDGIMPSRSRGSGFVRKSVAFTTDKEYRDEVLKRLKDEFRQIVRDNSKSKDGVTDDKEVFKLQYGTNCVCHICHARKKDCALFSCRYYAHNYCEYHTSTRLGFRASDCKDGSVSFDFCPICCLTCLCPKCTRKLDAISIDFKSKCDALGLSTQDNFEEVEMKCLPATAGFAHFGRMEAPGVGFTKKKKKPGKPARVSRPGRKSRGGDDSSQIPATKSVLENSESLHSHATRNRGKRDTSNNSEGIASTTTTTTSNSSLNIKNESKQKVCESHQTTKKVTKISPSEFPVEIRDGKDSDPSLQLDHLTIFTPNGSSLQIKPVAENEKTDFEEVVSAPEPNGSTEGNALSKDEGTIEDGSVDYCMICNKSGGLICCDTCPRAFHLQCINSRESVLAQSESKWECHECKKDRDEIFDDNSIKPSERTINLIYNAFHPLKEFPNFLTKMSALIHIYEIIQFLIKWDFGYIFENPLDVEELLGYLELVKRPMDLGTISSRIIHGKFASETMKKTKHWNDGENCIFDEILSLILIDIETVWHNCLIYNQEGSSVYRMAQVQRKKFMKLFNSNLKGNLTDSVLHNFAMFVQNHRQIRREILQNTAKKRLSEPKYKIELPRNKAGNCKPIAIFDPDTKMVVKQYSTQQAAVLAAMQLNERGFSAEFAITFMTVPKVIKESHKDPTKTIFGYRWMGTQYLRKGNFKDDDKIKDSVDNNEMTENEKMSSQNTKPGVLPSTDFKQNTIIYKFDKVSKQVMIEFESLNEAYKDWLDTCKSSIENFAGEKNIAVFEYDFVHGESDLDGIEWHLVQNELDDRADDDDDDDDNDSDDAHANAQNENNNKCLNIADANSRMPEKMDSLDSTHDQTDDSKMLVKHQNDGVESKEKSSRGEKRQHQDIDTIQVDDIKRVKIKLQDKTLTLKEEFQITPPVSQQEVGFQSVVSICGESLSILETFGSISAAASSANVDEVLFVEKISRREIINGKFYAYSTESDALMQVLRTSRESTEMR